MFYTCMRKPLVSSWITWPYFCKVLIQSFSNKWIIKSDIYLKDQTRIKSFLESRQQLMCVMTNYVFQIYIIILRNCLTSMTMIMHKRFINYLHLSIFTPPLISRNLRFYHKCHCIVDVTYGSFRFLLTWVIYTFILLSLVQLPSANNLFMFTFWLQY